MIEAADASHRRPEGGTCSRASSRIPDRPPVPTIRVLTLALLLVTAPSGPATPQSRGSDRPNGDELGPARLSAETTLRVVGATGRRGPRGRNLDTTYVDPSGAPVPLEGEPLGMALADLDGDRQPELVVAFAGLGESPGLVAVHRGNPHARKGREFPFLSPARLIPLPLRPDILLAGDFDGDEHGDLVVMTEGHPAMVILPGSGDASFGEPRIRPLPGAVTAAVAGQINRRDARDDFVVAVSDEEESRLLVFQGLYGALDAEPEVVPVPAPVTALALGRLDDHFARDLAFVADGVLHLVRGRDRRLPASAQTRRAVPPPVVEPLALPFQVERFTVGSFDPDEPYRQQLALLAVDGSLHRLDAGTRVLEQIAGSRLLFPGSFLVADGRAADASPHLYVVDPGRPEIGVLTARVSDGPEPSQRSRSEPALGRQSTRLEEAETLLSVGTPVALVTGHLDGDATPDLLVLTAQSPEPSLLVQEMAAKYTVDDNGNAADADPGNGVCATSGGVCTLHAAIQEHNNDAGGIDFAGPFLGANAIQPNFLPAITQPIVLDGGGQVEIDGTNQLGGNGLVVQAPGSTLAGLSIYRFGNAELVVSGAGSSVVQANNIGTFADGTPVPTEGSGKLRIDSAGDVRVLDNLVSGIVEILGSASVDCKVLDNFVGVSPSGVDLASGSLQLDDAVDTTVQGNVVASGTNQVWLLEGTSGTLVHDNQLGTAPDGVTALPCSPSCVGVRIDLSTNNTVSNNQISGNNLGAVTMGSADNTLFQNRIGTDPTGSILVGNGGGVGSGGDNIVIADNVIAGSSFDGINITGGGFAVEVLGNKVGTDITGTKDFGNAGQGIEAAGNVRIGGPGSERNIVSGNNNGGILINGSASGLAPVVENNFVGTDLSGGNPVPNGTFGIEVRAAFTEIVDNVIAATTGGSFNHGLNVNNASATDLVIFGNKIGVAADGVTPLGNDGAGIRACCGGYTIGDPASASRANIIAFNGGPGIDGGVVSSPPGIDFGINSIHSNGGLGIDIANDGVTANDSGDTDIGRQNFPVITAIVEDRVFATLDSHPNENYRIDFYEIDQCDPSGFGEGKKHVGQLDVLTDGTGTANFSLPLGILEVTATATRIATNETSEFSACVVKPAVVINSEGDAVDLAPGDGFCDTGNSVVISGQNVPECTLRAAILEANAHPGADRLIYDPNGPNATPGSYHIKPGSALPAVTERVVLGGLPGATDVELDGLAAGAGTNGLRFAFGASGSEVRRMVIYLYRDGIFVDGADEVVIVDSVVGTDRSDSTVLGNFGAGIHYKNADGGRIGGTAPGEGNHVAGNDGSGILIETSSGVLVQGNLIGTTSDGSAPLPNGSHGVELSDSTGSTVGGTEPLAQNIISGNGGAGVALLSKADDNEVLGNRIGTDLTGSAAVPNAKSGILVGNDGHDNVIAENLVSGNTQHGVLIEGAFTRRNALSANRIGTDFTGDAPLANGGHGVFIRNDAHANRIGKPDRNRIAFNTGDGIRVTGAESVDNRFDQNEIFSNGGLGIDLGGDGVTVNDLGDGDSGPNNRQNFPLITSYDDTGFARGSLSTVPNTGFLIDLFASASCDPSGHGEAERYIGFAVALSDASGEALWTAPPGFDPARPVLTATAIRVGSKEETSELSACLASQGAPPPALLINEVDADTKGPTALEFVELFSRGAVGLSLTGKVLVFYDGATDTSYAAFDLDGLATDGAGFFVAGNAAVPGVDLVFDDNLLLDGPAAVALYDGDATDFPDGTPVTTAGLVDAVVYGTGDADDPELLALLADDQPQVDEAAAGDSGAHSSQRCLNGSGDPLHTETFTPAPPTPDAANGCVTCLLSPAQSTGVEGSLHGVTARVLQDRIQPLANVPVVFEVVSGPSAGAGTAKLTDVAGEADFSYTGAGPGTDLIAATGTVGEAGFSCFANQIWEPAPVCADLTLENQTVTTVELFEACGTIFAGNGFVVGSTGDVTLRAGGSVVLQDGFSVQAGGSLDIEIDPALELEPAESGSPGHRGRGDR